MRWIALLLLATTAARIPAQAAGDESRYAIVGGTVFSMAGPPIADGVVLVRGRKIEKVGTASEVSVPTGTRVIDARGHWVTPGFIEPHNHTAVSDFNDIVYQVNPQFRVLDNLQLDTPALRILVAGGVTTALAIPGSGVNVAGWGIIVKTAGKTPEEVVVRFPGALKIAQAGNPERSSDLGAGPMGMNFLIRQILTQARDYHQAWERFERKETTTTPVKNPRFELFRGLFRHEYPVAVHTQNMQVVQSTMRILHDEFKLKIFIAHGTFNGFLNAPELAKRHIPVANGPRQVIFDRMEGRVIGLAAAWYWGGVGDDRMAVNTDDAANGMFPGEELPFHGTLAIRLGLPEHVALKGNTINAARMLGIEKRVGSLEPGKDADVVLWTGDPFDPRNRTRLVMIDGKVAYDTERDGVLF